MKVIKLNAIGSTNSYIKELSVQTPLPDELVVVAESQTEGRGQQHASWHSEAGKSLTFSVFKRFSSVEVSAQASLNFAVSLGLFGALQQLEIPNLAIKWPNDILSRQQKLAGILIENQIQGKFISSSVIGIGLNVNETSFKNLPQAISMKMATAKTYNVEEVRDVVVKFIFEELALFEKNDNFQLKPRYEKYLFKKNCVSTFELPDGKKINGKIQGVSNAGNLCIEHDDGIVNEYGFKEVKLLY